MTRDEAIRRVCGDRVSSLSKEWAEAEKFVDAYAALTQIEFEQPNETLRVERVAQALRRECLEVFGSAWNAEIARRFARIAIDADESYPPRRATPV